MARGGDEVAARRRRLLSVAAHMIDELHCSREDVVAVLGCRVVSLKTVRPIVYGDDIALDDDPVQGDDDEGRDDQQGQRDNEREERREQQAQQAQRVSHQEPDPELPI